VYVLFFCRHLPGCALRQPCPAHCTEAPTPVYALHRSYTEASSPTSPQLQGVPNGARGVLHGLRHPAARCIPGCTASLPQACTPPTAPYRAAYSCTFRHVILLMFKLLAAPLWLWYTAGGGRKRVAPPAPRSLSSCACWEIPDHAAVPGTPRSCSCVRPSASTQVALSVGDKRASCTVGSLYERGSKLLWSSLRCLAGFRLPLIHWQAGCRWMVS
jgi:hypothetical protein